MQKGFHILHPRDVCSRVGNGCSKTSRKLFSNWNAFDFVYVVFSQCFFFWKGLFKFVCVLLSDNIFNNKKFLSFGFQTNQVTIYAQWKNITFFGIWLVGLNVKTQSQCSFVHHTANINSADVHRRSRSEFWEVIGRRWKETWMSFRFRSRQYTAWLPLKDCWRKIFQHRCHIMFIFGEIMSMWRFLSSEGSSRLAPSKYFGRKTSKERDCFTVIVDGCSD